MDKAARRAAKTAWAARKLAWAVGSLTIDGRVWAKFTPNAAGLEKRLGFMVRQGGGRGLAPGMQEAIAAGGAGVFETRDELDADLSDLARDRRGAERLAHWAQALRVEVV